MAVKVMWARALRPQEDDAKTRAALAAPPPTGLAAAKRVPEKPKRRRSSVFDADGNEVFITLLCLKCHKTRPLSQFGLRRMADGAIRNQPWCRPCRSDASPRKQKALETAGAESAAAEDPAVSVESRRGGSPAGSAPPQDAGLLAAAVAAALHRGRS